MSTTDRPSLISLADIDVSTLRELVDRSVRHAAVGPSAATPLLGGTVLGLYFSRTSTRTRTAFSVAALRLGARLVTYGPGDLQLNTGESLEDTAQVFAGMLDGLVIRTAGPESELRTLAGAGLPVVNAMTENEHPTQAIADLTTIVRELGRLDGVSMLYVGEGNNTAAALALAVPRLGGRLELRTPPGYGLPQTTTELAHRLAAGSGGELDERHDMDDLPGAIDLVYTTRWQTTGTSKPDPDWRRTFAPFQVDAGVLDRTSATFFMHDLPAHRGEEVTADVLEGPRSIAFRQARCKLFSAMGVLSWMFDDDEQMNVT